MYKELSLSQKIANDAVDNAMNNIAERERKRFSLPKPTLTELDKELLIGISQGRSRNEINNALKAYSVNKSYNSFIRRMFKKFEAFTVPHVIYKAMKLGILD